MRTGSATSPTPNPLSSVKVTLALTCMTHHPSLMPHRCLIHLLISNHLHPLYINHLGDWSPPGGLYLPLETMTLKSNTGSITFSFPRSCLSSLEYFLVLYIFFYFTGISGPWMSILSSFLVMPSAFDSSCGLYVLLFQTLWCEILPYHYSFHCPCSILAKSQSWINPFSSLLYTHSELTSSAGEKPDSSVNWKP